MRIHLKYMDYDITPIRDDCEISNIVIKDSTIPMIHVFVDIANKCKSVNKMIDICTTVEQLNVFVPGLKFGIMEIKDPCNGLNL